MPSEETLNIIAGFLAIAIVISAILMMFTDLFTTKKK